MSKPMSGDDLEASESSTNYPTREVQTPIHERGPDLDNPPATLDAPPFCPPIPYVRPSNSTADGSHLDLLQSGEVLDDFELVRELGSGAFGRVFLAREVSLGRLVALKVSAIRGQEARTLARLEHGHIVQIFSEKLLVERDLALLCIQFIPGTTLERVIRALKKRPRQQWHGRTVIEILDAAETGPVDLDPAALREREYLAGCDFVELTCWIGARLAEALAHAHRLGILHRDIKPANVLVNRFGRPFLADFNVSSPVAVDGQQSGPLGGTLGYMAPEHLKALLPDSGVTSVAVDQRSDVYSLGLMLFELLTGFLPFERSDRPPKLSDWVQQMLADRRAGPPPLPADVEHSGPMACLLRRCLEPMAVHRFQSAADLALTLDGCREMRRVERSLPRPGPLARALMRWPFALGLLLILLPHVLATGVNISYNDLRIVGRLNREQRTAFHGLIFVYNGVVYPICVTMVLVFALRIRKVWGSLSTPARPSVDDVARARRELLRLPVWCLLVSCLGWLPGSVFFPFGIARMTGPIDMAVYEHFAISFAISWLIALTYSFFAAEFLALRVLYPALWTDARDRLAIARSELAAQGRRITCFQVLAVLIPLTAAVMMIGVGPEDFVEGYRTFRLLVTALIALGMGGLGLTMRVGQSLWRETLTALVS